MNELKRIKQAYENLAHEVGDGCGLGELNYAEKQDFETLEKHEKALEIIKKHYEVCECYNNQYIMTDNNGGSIELTQEEYDLLKQVLNEN